ncbi:MAG: DUF4114 domain-containing protein, partial [Nostocales cyanobacterium 94392]|nr:DUF4114 domain-containing protein [Nostocales cyanobacterium 94392]
EKILEINTNLIDTESFAHISIPPTTVENTFFVGALYKHNNNQANWIPISNNTPTNQSWIATSNTGNLDLENFSTSLLEDKNWLLRASSSDNSIITPVEPPNDIPIGIKLQKINNIELIDLTDQSGTIQTAVTVTRDADYDNLIGFYVISDVNGSIKINDEIINPGDTRYKQAALQNRITNLDLLQTKDSIQSNFNGTLSGGSIFAPFIIVDGTFNDALDNKAEVYFAYQAANSDNFDHIRLLGDNTLLFEDLPNGGDRDYNDLIIKMDFSI